MADGRTGVLTVPPFVGRLESYSSLLMLAGASEVIYIFSFVRRYPLIQYYRQDIDIGAITNHAELGLVSFLAAFVALFLLLALAWWQLPRGDDRSALAVILGCGGVFGVSMSFMYPITAVDVLMYVAHSRIMIHYHQNPIFVAPDRHPLDPVLALADGFSNVGAPYGPIGILVDAVPYWLTRGDLFFSVLGLKLLFTCMTLATAYLVYRLLRSTSYRMALTGALLVAWNPFVVFEISGNGHNDIVMLFLAVAGLLAVIEGKFALGSIVLFASALVKYGTAPMVLLVVLYCVRWASSQVERVRYVLATGAGCLVLLMVCYLPFWDGWHTLSRLLVEENQRTASLASVLPTILPGTFTDPRATLFSRAIFVPAFIFAVWLTWRRRDALIPGCFLSLLFFLALAVNNIKPWYAVWPTVLAAAAPSLSLRLASFALGFGMEVYTALFGFVWVWLGLDTPGSYTVVNGVSCLVVFVPALCLTVASWFDLQSLGMWTAQRQSETAPSAV